ncbi:hypothetical protein Q5P01_021259 [Channa striata]|uniref:protein-glutamine gamma-glutamyltransferase n=1 Tax=Channa striata TaxID=64152 RepID=A0AA88LTY9_CHASR|nr:hypothetical protein Q5P01_021259 [Channa striata]
MANSGTVAVDLRCRENNQAHRTKRIDKRRLIVRRGQPFLISLNCSESRSQYRQHIVQVALYLGRRQISVEENEARGRWWFRQQEAQSDILLTLHSPADAPIGQYNLIVYMTTQTIRKPFFLLFNPWCTDDAVYQPDERLLQEYVMNQNGIIYQGNADGIINLQWNYGQFEKDVIDICFKILDNSTDARNNPERDTESRSDPVYVSRTIIAMVNNLDDSGVLVGKWIDPYVDGAHPLSWNGSVTILRQWSFKGPVKYGQCWVFAGVACTVLRCLGIPTRVITNFNSAHDVNGDVSIDFEVSEDGNESTPEIIWNYHCWVESWMRRNDLPEGNDGWQVLDPTPQERSDGMYRCGPCPVTAIKEGNLSLQYDAQFIFAEVNADVVHWKVKRNDPRIKIKVEQSRVGTNISTKAVHGEYREDVTLDYKYPEGSREERQVYERTGRQVPQRITGTSPGQLQLTIKHDNPAFGRDFDITFEVRNTGPSTTHAVLQMRAVAVIYNGIRRGICRKHKVSVSVPAYETQREMLHLRYNDYAPYVSEHHLIKARAILEVKGEDQTLITTAHISLSLPKIQVQVMGRVVVRERVTAYFSFTNPLPVPLRDGVFSVEGNGLLNATTINVPGSFSPGQNITGQVSFFPERRGVRKLLVGFDSDILHNLKGEATVVVRKPDFFFTSTTG